MSYRANLVEIRGLAAPFGRPTYIAGRGVEVLDPRVFDGMLAGGKRVPVLWDSHDEGAGTIRLAEAATLFAGPAGLMFSARLDLSRNWGLLAAIVRRRDPVDQVSVGGLDIEDQRAERIGGAAAFRVLKASIGHVTICKDAAYRTATGVWRADVALDEAPWRIREMSALWEAGRAVAKLQDQRRRLCADAERLANARSDGAGGDLSANQLAAVRAKVNAVRAIDSKIKAMGAPR